MHVVVSGAAGNLGRKIRAHLAEAEWCARVTALDVVPVAAGAKEAGVVADLTDGTDQRWIGPVEAADAVVHLAATDPAPGSGWTHGRDSLGITANLLAHAGRSRACRFVFASSNHAMGLYKDVPVPGAGKIGAATPPLAGTSMWDGRGYFSAAGYGASKLYGERLCLAMAEASGGRLSAVALRIGWCQTGENLPRTLVGGAATPEGAAPQDPAEAARDLKWFRNMWLSNRDYVQAVERALRADASGWPRPAVVVAAVSNNAGTPWDLEEARALIGYQPVDDVWAELEKDGV